MLKMGKMIILLSFLLQARNNHVSATFAQHTENFAIRRNEKLTNVQHFVKYGLNQRQCFGQCFYFPKCHSINVNEAERICVVNYEVNDAEKDSNMVSEIGWVYYEKKVK